MLSRVKLKVKAFMKTLNSSFLGGIYACETPEGRRVLPLVPFLPFPRPPAPGPRSSDLVLVGGVEGDLDDLGVPLPHLLHRAAAQLDALQERRLGGVARHGPLWTEGTS